MIKSYLSQLDSLNEMITDIREFLLQTNRKQIDTKEYELLSEELLIKLIEASDSGEEIEIKLQKRMAGSAVVMSCKGNPIYLDDDDENTDLGAQIVQTYSERVSYARKHGVNQFTVAFGTSVDSIIQHMNLAGILAIFTSLLMCLFLGESQLEFISQQILSPIMMFFVKLLQNIAPPITFISLLAYVIKFHASYEFDVKMRKVAIKYILTSALAVLIPFAVIILTSVRVVGDANGEVGGMSISNTETVHVLGNSLGEIVGNFLPENLINVFTNSNPIPMLLIAVLFGIVINSYAGKQNDQLRKAVYVFKDFLCRVVSLVFSLLPFFLYVAIVGLAVQYFQLHVLWQAIKVICLVTALIFALFAVHCVVYVAELKMAGISLRKFWTKYKDVLIHNFKIGSNIEALPYNMRVFRQKIKDPGKQSSIRSILELGAQVNMDGNCVIITTFIMFICQSMDFQKDLLFFTELLLAILLLGIGSPNQPGSFTISTMILIGFLNLSENLCLTVIVFESIFFRFYSTLNAFGDIVAVVSIEDDQLKKNRKCKAA